jgi:hypothetical protein
MPSLRAMAKILSPGRFKSWIKTISPSVITCLPLPLRACRRRRSDWGLCKQHCWGDYVRHSQLDNYAVHKHAKVKAWLARHPRWTCHFTPTSAPWLNAVEGFFAKLSRRKLQHGVFHSVVALQTVINDFVEQHNRNSKPFAWRADPKDIITAVKRGHQVLETIS